MSIYKYRAKDKENRVAEGMVEAASEEIAADILTDKDLRIISIIEQPKFDLLTRLLEVINRISPRDVVFFSRQVSVMISANVPIVQSLRILSKQTNKVSLKAIISNIADDVDGGTKFSQGLSKYPNIFDSFFVNVVRAGETSGKLSEVLEYLANEKEKDFDLMSKIKGAMIYPAVILGGMLVVGFVMMVKVIPQLTNILQEGGTELPFSTKLLISSSKFMEVYWWSIFIIFAIFVLVVRYLLKTNAGRLTWDVAKLKLPVFGRLFQKIYIVRFTRSLATLIKGGVIITNSLKICADVVGNQIYKDILDKTVKEIEDGNSIATVFLKSKAVPVMIPHMLAVGEETGKIDEVLEKMGDFYSKEIDNMVVNLVTLIEPLIMIMLGVAVGFMISAILLPMWQLASVI